MTKKVLNDLFDYGLKIYQNDTYFKFSIDAIILSEYVKLTSNTKKILDLCTGNAAIPLILSTKTKAHIDAFEIQKDIYDLGIESIKYNNKNEQITLYNANVLDINKFKNHEKYDIITCNPPYFKVNDKSLINTYDALAIARHEIKITLEDIFKISSDHLDTKGELYLVHRLTRLDEIIILAHKYDLNVKNVEIIKTKDDNKPSIVLVRCIKGSSYGIKVNNEKDLSKYKTYQNMFKEEK